MPLHANRNFTCVLLLALAVSTLSCDSPTAPNPSDVLAFDVPASGNLTPGDTARFFLDVDPGLSFVVYVTAIDDPISLRVESAGGAILSVVAIDTTAMKYGVPVLDVSTKTRFTVLTAVPVHSRGGPFTIRPARIDMRPEHGPAAVSLGAIVSGERIDHRFDVDEFLVDVPSTQDAEFYLRLDGPTRCGLSSSITREGALQPTFSRPHCAFDPSLDLERDASGHIALEGGRYRIRFTATTDLSYTFQLRTVDRRPESANAQLVLGDTIAESIDYVGDVDEFVLPGIPGEEYEIFVSASGTAPHQARVTFPGLNIGAHAEATLGAPLLDTPTGRLTMPPDGQVMVRVEDLTHTNGLYRGAYRLLAVRIDRAPEDRASEIVPDGSVIASALELYGDVDEYRFTLDQPTRLALRCAPNAFGGCSVYFAGVYDDRAPTQAVNLDSDSPLPAGAYRLRVDSRARGDGPARGMYRGAYQLALSAIDTVAEQAGTAAVGSTITEEARWPKDIDTWVLAVPRTDTMRVLLNSPDTATTVVIELTEQLTGRPISVCDGTETRRVDLAPGDYVLRVSTAKPGWNPGARWHYDLQLERASAAPEERSSSVAFGDTIRSMLDYLGDIDDYFLRGVPGEMVSVALIPEAPDWSGQQFFAVSITDSATETTLASPSTTRLYQDGVPVQIPQSGVLRFRVCSLLGCPINVRREAYTLVMNRVNLAPESRASTFNIGDVVADSLEVPYDVDDFTFTGAAGQVVDLVGLQAPQQWYDASGVKLELVNLTTGAEIAALQFRDTDAQSGNAAVRAIVLPNAGNYLVRVRAEPHRDLVTQTGLYRFTVTPH